MPYDNVSAVPAYVKKYTSKIQRQWMHVFNSTYDKVMKETKSSKKAEVRAMKAANSVLKKRFLKNKESNSHKDYFSYLIDSYMGNLEG